MKSDPAHSRFFIALMLPDEVEHYANRVIADLSDRYKMRTAKAAPHITLQPPFIWPLESVATLEGAIATIAQTLAPIPIQLSGFGCFAPRVLYINVNKTPELLMTQVSLMQYMEDSLDIVDKKSQNRAFSPHVTVASRKMTPSSFKQAWQYLSNQTVNFEFVCDRLTLLIYTSEGWHIHAAFPLTGIHNQ